MMEKLQYFFQMLMALASQYRYFSTSSATHAQWQGLLSFCCNHAFKNKRLRTFLNVKTCIC